MENIKFVHILNSIHNLIEYPVRITLGDAFLLVEIVKQVAILCIVHYQVNAIILLQYRPQFNNMGMIQLVMD